MTFDVRSSVVEGGRVLVVDSVTDVRSTDPELVAVTGSHGGVTAILYAIAAGLSGVVVNDAGVGCDDAGIAGLRLADASGLAVAAVSHDSARIGDAEDTLASGVISHANETARACGVRARMSATEAATLMIAAHLPSVVRSDRSPVPLQPARVVLADGDPPVIGLASASSVSLADARSIIVAGSHGGLVGGAPLRRPVLAAVFNDAGVGKDRAGIARLPRLDALGIPGLAVSHQSARIGDAVHAYEHGRISHVNETARAFGAAPGQTVRDATALLAERIASALGTSHRIGDPQPCHR